LIDVRYDSDRDQIPHHSEMTRCATTGHKALPESGVGDLGRASVGPCGFAGAGVR
jgi:hypothetical protein